MDQTRSFASSNLACKARGATLVQIDDRLVYHFDYVYVMSYLYQ